MEQHLSFRVAGIHILPPMTNKSVRHLWKGAFIYGMQIGNSSNSSITLTPPPTSVAPFPHIFHHPHSLSDRHTFDTTLNHPFLILMHNALINCSIFEALSTRWHFIALFTICLCTLNTYAIFSLFMLVN